jgi:hypothetical protein
MLFYNPSQTASVKAITGHMAVPMATTNAGLQFIFNAVWTGGNGAIDGFQSQFSAGNITSGTIKIYGLV